MSAGISAPVGRRGGRPPAPPREVALRVVELRHQGLSYEAISEELNTTGVPTPMGGSRWLKSHVNRLLHTRYAQEMGEENDANSRAERLTGKRYDTQASRA
jgi:hypothetical protein